jgi:2-oxoglutarate dehydrogenase E2 component (dihydrolipoamide succinyltransferase)
MPIIEMLMPKMGESIMEATVLTWLKKVGETITVDDSILEVATDKIDTEVPASHSGVLHQILVKEGQIAEIGKPICLIMSEKDESPAPKAEKPTNGVAQPAELHEFEKITETILTKPTQYASLAKSDNRFYSPLVLNIAKAEGLSQAELDSIIGTGLDERVTKEDLQQYLTTGKNTIKKTKVPAKSVIKIEPNDEVITMDRMRSMIATRMIDSQAISAHVTSFVECDMTDIVNWRNSVKKSFSATYGENITFTPILMQAVARAIEAFPMINIQVDENRIIKKGNINIGMAVALPNGNLVVPNIPNANKKSLLELTKYVNDLTVRGRENRLKPEDLEGGTYTVSNIGTFGNIMGTPIILQPQVAIIAFGAIIKTPAVIQTEAGDTIAIRHRMYISHSYDHRVIDGSLGGQFVKKVADLLEKFDGEKELAHS